MAVDEIRSFKILKDKFPVCIIIREQIKNLVSKAYRCLQKKNRLPDVVIPKIIIERPAKSNYGDFVSNSALVTGAVVDVKPPELVNMVTQEIETNDELCVLRKSLIERIESSGPGFYKFCLKKEFLQKQVTEILKQAEDYGSNAPKNQKIQVEFISANPTGPLTVGNARGGPYGDTLANVLKKSGYEVEKAYYVNDIGQQILKLGHSVLKDKDAVYQGDYIDKLHKTIKEKDAFKAGQAAAKIITEDYIKKAVAKTGIKFDRWYFESDLYQSGQVDRVLAVFKKKKLLYKKQGATWFKSAQFGDIRDRVLIKSDGNKTYLAGDLALHQAKFEKDRFDKVINIWGADHAGDVAGLQAGVEALGYKGKLDIILMQFVTLTEKGKKLKMSKRSGNLVLLSDLLKEVGSDVVRFLFLQKSNNTHLNFNLDLARQQSEKNPVFYVQYAYARICSILCKTKQSVGTGRDLSLQSEFEFDLIKQLIRLPEIIADTVCDYQVHRLPTYAMELAASFHRFYKNCRVLGNQDKNLDQARLCLISAAKIVLKNTLDLMGISAPEKM